MTTTAPPGGDLKAKLMERLRQANGAAAPAAPAPPVAAVARPTGILSPDAPPREAQVSAAPPPPSAGNAAPAPAGNAAPAPPAAGPPPAAGGAAAGSAPRRRAGPGRGHKKTDAAVGPATEAAPASAPACSYCGGAGGRHYDDCDRPSERARPAPSAKVSTSDADVLGRPPLPDVPPLPADVLPTPPVARAPDQPPTMTVRQEFEPGFDPDRIARDFAPAVQAKRRLALYIDCGPVKGADRAGYVLLEEWLAPLLAVVASENQVPDYRMMKYGEGKAALAALVRAAIADPETAPPEVLVCSSFSPGADEALAVLIPHATDAVKGFKG